MDANSSGELAQCLGRAMELLTRNNAVLTFGNQSVLNLPRVNRAKRIYIPQQDSGNAAILLALQYRCAVDYRSAVSQQILIQTANRFRSTPLNVSNQYVSIHFLVTY